MSLTWGGHEVYVMCASCAPYMGEALRFLVKPVRRDKGLLSGRGSFRRFTQHKTAHKESHMRGMNINTTDDLDLNDLNALSQDHEFLNALVEVLLTSGVHEVVWSKTPRARLGQHMGPVTPDHMARGLRRVHNAPHFRFFKDSLLDREPCSTAAGLVWLSAFPNSETAKRELNNEV